MRPQVSIDESRVPSSPITVPARAKKKHLLRTLSRSGPLPNAGHAEKTKVSYLLSQSLTPTGKDRE